MKEAVLWNQATENPETEKVRGKFLTKQFLIPIQKASGYIEKKKIILKVDLWNEGIDLQRNILRHINTEDNLLYGIDIAFNTCILAKKYTPSIKISTGTISALAFRDKSFDMILDLSTSDHVPSQTIPLVLAEYARVLKPYGMLVLIFDWWGLVWRVYMYYLEKVHNRSEYFFKNTDIPSRYIHPISFMKKTAENAGFMIKEEYCIDYTGCMWNRLTKPFWDRLPDKTYDALLSLEYSKISKYLRPFAKQYVIIAQKNNSDL